jgi:hypothetical protein
VTVVVIHIHILKVSGIPCDHVLVVVRGVVV